MNDYENFIQDKSRIPLLDGVVNIKLPKCLKPFQKAATTWALSRRRSALFAGTGLGKTLKQLCWAQAVSKLEDGPVLILTPLAVAQQTVKEAAKFDIKNVGYASDQRTSHKITVTNYDRVENFDPGKFAAVVLDESSIIKHNDSKTRKTLINMFSKTSWRLCCTATPSPNDFVEIGSHSEFLGIMDSAEMLAMFFVHEGAIRAVDSDEEWRLKRHAEDIFWKWLSSWALVYASPRDLGFNELGYDLPELRRHLIKVDAVREPPPGKFFADNKMTLRERISTRKSTVGARVAAAAKLIDTDTNSSWLVWCGRNDEADSLERSIPGAAQVSGSMLRELKQERLLGFQDRHPRILITKPSIAGFGMNWQHCHKVVFVGLNDSFEQLYQAIRRCWRFGQKHPVDAYIISSTAEYAVLKNVLDKEQRQEKLYRSVAALSRVAVQSIGAQRPQVCITNEAKFSGDFPEWL